MAPGSSRCNPLSILYALLKAAASRVVPSLRGHLAAFLSGTASSNLRQRMFEEIISGSFPSPRFRNSVEGSYQGQPVNFGLYESFHRVHQDVTRHSARCARLCCTGVFIVEAMLKVNVLRLWNCVGFDCLLRLSLMMRFESWSYPTISNPQYGEMTREASMTGALRASCPSTIRLFSPRTQSPSFFLRHVRAAFCLEHQH